MGAMLRASGADYFNPDEATQRALAANPSLTPAEANSWAWHEGKRLLERAIAESGTFAIETTLGGSTISGVLLAASRSGHDVRVWFVGLEGVHLHLARIRSRVDAGGHDIDPDKVRERYDTSRQNLIRLLPAVAEVKVFDNTADGDPAKGRKPKPRLILHVRRGKIVSQCPIETTPTWAKPIVAAARANHESR